MAKGRKRKTGRREPNGKPSRAGKPRFDVRSVALEQPHRRWLVKEQRADQAAECMIGRALLAKIITAPEYWAGMKYRGLMDAFHAVLATPITRRSSAAFGVPDSGWTIREAGEDELQRRDRVLIAIADVTDALRGQDKAVSRELNAVVLRDAQIGDLALMRKGLFTLVKLWRLDTDTAVHREGYWRDERPTAMELLTDDAEA